MLAYGLLKLNCWTNIPGCHFRSSGRLPVQEVWFVDFYIDNLTFLFRFYLGVFRKFTLLFGDLIYSMCYFEVGVNLAVQWASFFSWNWFVIASEIDVVCLGTQLCSLPICVHPCFCLLVQQTRNFPKLQMDKALPAFWTFVVHHLSGSQLKSCSYYLVLSQTSSR